MSAARSSVGFIRSLLLVVPGLLIWNASVADTTIAQSKAGDYYRSSRPTLKQSDKGVLAYCKKESGKSCTIISRSKLKSYGFGAVAASDSHFGTSFGYGDTDEAKDRALDACAEVTPTNQVCKIVLTFNDDSRQPLTRTNGQVPPWSSPMANQAVQPVPTKNCYQEQRLEPQTNYENVCDYNQYGPVNCRNVARTFQTTKTVTICP